MTFRIRYLDFWPGFEPRDFLLTRVIKLASGGDDPEIIFDESKLVDLEICSTFGFKSIRQKILARSLMSRDLYSYNDYICRTSFGHRLRYDSPSKKRIWYTGENLRPPVDLFEGTISFDRTDSSRRNLFFPLIYFGIDWFEEGSELDYQFTPEKLISVRTHTEIRKMNACSFATNVAPTRERLLQIVSNFMPVDRFGKSVGRPVVSKLDVSRNYQFQVCNENSLYPGYVTEKLMDAWKSGNVAIWTGMVQPEIGINPEAYLDFTLLNDNEISEILAKLDEQKIVNLMNAPIMKTLPKLDPLIEFIGEILN